jgi:hypothetical protein
MIKFINSIIMIPLLPFAMRQDSSRVQPVPDPFARLTVYNGTWTVRAEHTLEWRSAGHRGSLRQPVPALHTALRW